MISAFIDKKMTRREVLKAAAMTLGAIGVSGCGPVVNPVVRIVVHVAWPHIQRLLTVIVRNSGELVVTAIVAAGARTLWANLNTRQAESLRNGSHLVLVTEDGTEHQIPFRYDE